MEAMSKTTELEVFNETPLINLRQAYVTEIELKDGTKTQMVTFFNNSELNFEEVQIGIATAVERCENTHKMKSTFCTVSNGIVKTILSYQERKIVHYDPRKDKNLKQY